MQSAIRTFISNQLNQNQQKDNTLAPSTLEQQSVLQELRQEYQQLQQEVQHQQQLPPMLPIHEQTQRLEQDQQSGVHQQQEVPQNRRHALDLDHNGTDSIALYENSSRQVKRARKNVQKETAELNSRLLELDLQKLEEIRKTRPRIQPQMMWAKRAYRRSQPSLRPLPNGSGETSCSHKAYNEGLEQSEIDDFDMEETEEVEEEGEEELESASLEVNASDMAIADFRGQGSQVGQSLGVAMEQRLDFFSRQMNARHKPTTIRQYAQHTVAWKTFCNKVFDGNDLISPVRIALFLTDTVFGRTRRIILNPGLKNFDGVIGVTATDPQVDKDVHHSEVKEIERRFEEARSEPAEKDGRIRLDIPIGMATARGVLKALVSLWEQQRASGKNNEEHPGKSLVVKSVMDQYERKLVAAKVTASLDRGASCPLRDVYSVQQFVEMMARLWRPIKEKGLKILELSNISTRMSLALRHQMCLRDQDIRGLDLADCFSVRVRARKALRGATRSVLGLVFSLRTGKSVTAGTTQFSIALRHKEFARCAVGAFAFHLFQRFHIQDEPSPNMDDPEDWQRIKALRQKSKDPHISVKYQHQHASTRAAYSLVGITTSRATHGNRHCGVQEAESEGLDPANLSRLGRWNHDKMTTYYLSGIAIPGAFASAGFHDETYSLDR